MNVLFMHFTDENCFSLNTVADLGMAVGSILMTPGDFSDKTICLNGPLTDCETASEAFSAALGKTVIYEQATYESYKQVRHPFYDTRT